MRTQASTGARFEAIAAPVPLVSPSPSGTVVPSALPWGNAQGASDDRASPPVVAPLFQAMGVGVSNVRSEKMLLSEAGRDCLPCCCYCFGILLFPRWR